MRHFILIAFAIVTLGISGCSSPTETVQPRPNGFWLSIVGTPSIQGNTLGVNLLLTDSLKPVKGAQFRYVYYISDNISQKTDSVTNLKVYSDSLGRFDKLGIVISPGTTGFKFRAVKDSLWSNEVPYQLGS